MTIPQTITNEGQIGAENTYLLEKDPPPTTVGPKIRNVGIAGECVRGPANVVLRVGDPGRFEAVYGGRDFGSGGAIIGDIWQFMLNRTFGTMYLVRVVAADAVTAERDFLATATPIVNIAASSPGAYGNDILIDVELADDGDAAHWNLLITWNEVFQKFPNLDTSATGNDNILVVMGDDESLLVTVTKLADGRPDDIAAQALDDTAGAEGTVVDADFTGAGAAHELLANHVDVHYIADAGRVNTALKTDLNTKAAAAGPGKHFVVGPDSEVTSQSTFETEVNAFTASDRLIACFNHERIFDPTTSAKIFQQPEAQMLSNLSQTGPNQHVGAKARRKLAAGTIELAHELSEPDYTSLRENRICGLERVKGGFIFRSGVTTEPGTNGEIAARRQKDHIILAASERQSFDVKEPNSQTNRDARTASVGGFLDELAANEEIVASTGGEADAIYDTETLNTTASRATGLQRDRLSVRIIPHNLFMVLVSTIDTANSEFFTTEAA